MDFTGLMCIGLTKKVKIYTGNGRTIHPITVSDPPGPGLASKRMLKATATPVNRFDQRKSFDKIA